MGEKIGGKVEFVSDGGIYGFKWDNLSLDQLDLEKVFIPIKPGRSSPFPHLSEGPRSGTCCDYSWTIFWR